MAVDLRPEEVTTAIKKQLEEIETGIRPEEYGTVLEVGDGIARVYGLEGAMAGELIEFPQDIYGLVLNLEEDNTGCILLGPDTEIKEGDEVSRTGEVVRVPVGEELIGRVVDPLGEPLDGRGELAAEKTRPVEAPAPGVIERQPVDEPLQTGLKAIDSMVPIGRGQRELIIGDRQTGKTAIAIDTILNQKDTGVFCVYVAIGQKTSTVAQIVHRLQEEGAMSYTSVVAAGASEQASLQYLAPYSGCAVAEEFMYGGEDVLVVYDDLTKHSRAYRSTSLLLRRPPGREAFPGDVFYLHSRLLERAARLHQDQGGGSMTALPIVETQAGDVSAYIPTNVISITDGQIFLESELFFSGVRPAVNVGLSVSRVGGDAQLEAMKDISGRLRLDLAQYRELAAFAQFGSELDESTRSRLAKGERIVEILKQPQYKPMPVVDQIIVIYAVVNNFLEDIPLEDIERFESELLEYMRDNRSALLDTIAETGQLTEEIEKKVEETLREFLDGFEITPQQGDEEMEATEDENAPEIAEKTQENGDAGGDQDLRTRNQSPR